MKKRFGSLLGKVFEGDVVPFKRPKADSTKYNVALTNQKIDQDYPNMIHRTGVGETPCSYCNDKDCDYDCEGSQNNLHNESYTIDGEDLVFETYSAYNKAKLHLDSLMVPYHAFYEGKSITPRNIDAALRLLESKGYIKR